MPRRRRRQDDDYDDDDDVGWRCPYCHSDEGKRTRTRISTAGVITIIALLLICFPIFWIGLLMTESHDYCRDCGTRLN